MDAFVFVKQRKAIQVGQAEFFDIKKHFLQPWPCGKAVNRSRRKATELPLWWSEKDMRFVFLHKEQHAIMKSLTDYGYSGMDNDTKVCQFLHVIKSPELKAAVNIVWIQQEMYWADFDATMSNLGQMVTKKRLIEQVIHIVKTRSQTVRPKVASFTRKIKCKKYPKAVWNSMTKEQQMQVCKLHEQQSIKPAIKQTSADARIAALEVNHGINYQPKDGDVKKLGRNFQRINMG